MSRLSNPFSENSFTPPKVLFCYFFYCAFTVISIHSEILFHVVVVIFVECNENILDRRTADVSKLLTKLRSVSMTDHHGNSDWKVCFFLFTYLYQWSWIEKKKKKKRLYCYSWNMILKIAVSCTVKVSMGVLFTLCSLKVTWMPLSKNVSYFSFLLEYKIKVLENM